MAWRFKVSKYKNASPKFLKKEENILDLPVTDVTQSCGNHIKASCVYVVFNIDSTGGGNLGFLPLSASGRQDNSLPTIQAHGDFVSDFDFSPFDDYLLATGSQDCKVSLWLLPDENNESNDPAVQVATLPVFERRVENVLWNPRADGVIAVTSQATVKIFDVTGASVQEISAFSGHGDQIQSVSWKEDGNLIATSCRDKIVRVIDPRSGSVVQEGKGHQNVKDSRILWLQGKDFLLSTGFSQTRMREYRVWDPRNLSSSLTSSDIDSSTGTVMPFYDPDTAMTFLIGKGDTSLNFLEFTERDPYLTTSGVDRCDQIKGAAMVPKRAMNLMDGEVNRLMLLCQRSVVPAPYIVPRKSYRDFHSDIYPDTLDGIPTTTAKSWINSEDSQPAYVNLQPGKPLIRREQRGVLVNAGQPSGAKSTSQAASPARIEKPVKTAEQEPLKPKPSYPQKEKQPDSFPKSYSADAQSIPNTSSQPKSVSSTKAEEPPREKPQITKPKPTVKPFAGVRQSKFRHIQGTLLHPSVNYTNVRSVCKTTPGESDMFAANTKRCAIPLDGPGGCMHVLDFSKACRLPDTGVPVIQNGSKVTDFAWDPFDDSRLVTVLDNAKINVWRIPNEGLTESTDEPEFSLRGHMEKIYFVRFHPLASGLITTASYDMTVRMWDLEQQKQVMELEGLDDQVFCLSWSYDGKQLATVSKDKKVRVFDPRKSRIALREGPGPEGTRGARVVWAVQDTFLVVSGFDKQSMQQVLVYRSNELEILHSIDVTVSPAILIPFYDPDSSVVFLTSRGERLIYTFEVCGNEEPYLFECAPFKMETLHQSVAYLPKNVCDVRKVEVARAWRLTDNSVEAMSFSVPRVRAQFFQDDLFPDTRVSWKSTMTAQEWLNGSDKQSPLISLKPADMTSLSEAPAEEVKAKKFESYNPDTYKTDSQRKEELLNAMVGKLEIMDEPLPQDLTEGVEDDEWDD